MLPSRTVYSLTREMYLAGCELHIKTLTFLVLTLKQYVNVKITWGSEVETSIAMTIIASFSWLTRPQSSSFLKCLLGKRLVLDPNLHFTPDLQSSVCILPSVCISSPVCSLQSLYFKKNKTFKRKTYAFTKIYCFKSGEIWASSINRYMPHKPQTGKYRRSVSLIII